MAQHGAPTASQPDTRCSAAAHERHWRTRGTCNTPATGTRQPGTGSLYSPYTCIGRARAHKRRGTGRPWGTLAQGLAPGCSDLWLSVRTSSGKDLKHLRRSGGAISTAQHCYQQCLRFCFAFGLSEGLGDSRTREGLAEGVEHVGGRCGFKIAHARVQHGACVRLAVPQLITRPSTPRLVRVHPKCRDPTTQTNPTKHNTPTIKQLQQHTSTAHKKCNVEPTLLHGHIRIASC